MNNEFYRKGDRTLKILEAISRGVLDLSALFEAFLVAGYGASLGMINREERRIKNRNEKILNHLIEEEKELQKFRVLISKLKREGFIKSRERGNNVRFFITLRGFKKIKNLRDYQSQALPSRASYEREISPFYTIVAFDVPEREKPKREWLRFVLKNLGFNFIQKSVGIGKVKIPAEFLNDLKRLKILDFVEIFQITKSGTLKQIE